MAENILEAMAGTESVQPEQNMCANCEYYQEPLCMNSLSNSQILSKDEKQPLSVTPEFGCNNFEPRAEEQVQEEVVEEQVREPIVPPRY